MLLSLLKEHDVMVVKFGKEYLRFTVEDLDEPTVTICTLEDITNHYK